jgi:hypothetical protein
MHIFNTGNDNNSNSNSNNHDGDTCSIPCVSDQHSEVPSLNSGRDTLFRDFFRFLYDEASIFQKCCFVGYVM